MKVLQRSGSGKKSLLRNKRTVSRNRKVRRGTENTLSRLDIPSVRLCKVQKLRRVSSDFDSTVPVRTFIGLHQFGL